MQSKIIRCVAAGFLLGSLIWSCAGHDQRKYAGQKISDNPVRLTVINQLQGSMQIYWRPDFGSEVYLGRITIGETKTFLLRPPFPPGRAYLVARQTLPAWSGEPVIAELAEPLSAGDTLTWDLQINRMDWRAGAAEQ